LSHILLVADPFAGWRVAGLSIPEDPMSVRTLRNLVSVAMSLLVLVGLIGAAGADVPGDVERRPMQQQPSKPVRHETRFHKVPDSKLQIRAIEYDGSTNGTLTVQLKNSEKSAMKFSATGLYFVPAGDPDSAPQRLGAVGPMQIVTEGTKASKEVTSIEIAAGETVEVVLDVFCIDSHRSSPSPQNVFSVGAKRMPKELAQTIEKRADSVVSRERAKGTAAPRPAAKAAIQSEVWKSRDAKWIQLDGEGVQEATK
jgi:hypothetical protein